jgi:transcriptional antiterminator
MNQIKKHLVVKYKDLKKLKKFTIKIIRKEIISLEIFYFK